MEDIMKKGMNPEAVDQMATAMTESGETVRNLFEQTASRVEGFDWTGEDRDRYVSEFRDGLGALTEQVVSRAGELAERARANAQAQRGASS
ncbi:hypothetical protein [Brachybacterium saurashtrense]|nr:hypothetical protein [Brachybacterium saurashtrense]